MGRKRERRAWLGEEEDGVWRGGGEKEERGQVRERERGGSAVLLFSFRESDGNREGVTPSSCAYGGEWERERTKAVWALGSGVVGGPEMACLEF